MNNLKRSLLTLLACGCVLLAYSAGTPTVSNRTILFQFFPDTSDFAGLSTNDYLTNISFNVFSSTNASIPLAQWPLLTNLPAAGFISQGPCGTWWTNVIALDGYSRFYVMNTSNQNGAASFFSPVAVWVPQPAQGKIAIR